MRWKNLHGRTRFTASILHHRQCFKTTFPNNPDIWQKNPITVLTASLGCDLPLNLADVFAAMTAKDSFCLGAYKGSCGSIRVVVHSLTNRPHHRICIEACETAHG